MSNRNQLFLVGPDADEQRLDIFLVGHLPEMTRSRIQQLIVDGNIRVNDRIPNKTGYKLKSGDKVAIDLPAPIATEVKAEEISLDIVFEDNDLMVINKRRGMVVHPAAGNQQGTLVNALLAHCTDLSGINGVIRPGIVHRLDKDTSGVMVAAKTEMAHQALSEDFAARRIDRAYLAFCWGLPNPAEGDFEGAIGRD